MLVSRCCRQDVQVEGIVTHYYCCIKCHRPCDLVEWRENHGRKHETAIDEDAKD